MLDLMTWDWGYRQAFLSELVRVAKHVPDTHYVLDHHGMICAPGSYMRAIAQDPYMQALLNVGLKGDDLTIDGVMVVSAAIIDPQGLAYFLFRPGIDPADTVFLANIGVDATPKNVLMARLATLQYAFNIKGNLDSRWSAYDGFRSLYYQDIDPIFRRFASTGVFRFTHDTEVQQ